MHFALAVGGAVLFSLYIVYDVYEISKRVCCGTPQQRRLSPRVSFLSTPLTAP